MLRWRLARHVVPAALALAWLVPTTARADEVPVISIPGATLSADEAIAALRAGNARFVGGTSSHPHLSAKRIAETSTGQHPIATILGCSDSRVPPELVFDEGIGD